MASKEAMKEVESFLTKKGRQETLLGMVSVDSIDSFSGRQARLQAAEEESVAKTMRWDMKSDEEGDEMKNLVAGDMTTNHYQPEKKSMLGPLLAAGLGMAIPGAGLVGFLANNYLSSKPDVIENIIDGETVNLGLGRIEDYK